MSTVQSMIRAFVDQINGDIAVLLYEPDQKRVEVPLQALPPRVSEGAIVRWTTSGFVVDEEATASEKQTVQSLMDELGNNP